MQHYNFNGELAMMEIDLKSENIDTLIQEVSKGVSALSEGPLRRMERKARFDPCYEYGQNSR